MHMKGNPQTMISLANYKNVTKEVAQYFGEKCRILFNKGVKDIILDPGFGFAKGKEQNYELLKNLSYLKMLNLPIMAGISRKSMIYKALEISANESLNGTTVLNTIALQKGAKILRVHDVKEAVECVQLLSFLEK